MLNNRNQKHPILESFRQYQKIYQKTMHTNKSTNSLLIKILTQFAQYEQNNRIGNSTIGEIINKICQILYPGIKSVEIEEKMKMIMGNFEKLCERGMEGKQMACEMREYEKQLGSRLIHLLLHYSGTRHICRIVLILAAFMALGIIRRQAINFTFMGMIMAYEYIGNKEQIQIIQVCLSFIFPKFLQKSESNPFLIIACLIYFNKNLKEENISKIQQLITCPYQITSMFLKFRQEYTHNQSQHMILQCDRNFSHLALSIIDNLVIKIILDMLQNPKLSSLHEKLLIVLNKLVRYDLSVLIVKNMLKKLEISEVNLIKSNWKRIFQVMRHCLTCPVLNHESIKFESKKAYLKIGGMEKVNEMMFKYRSYRLDGELMLFKIVSDNQNSQYNEIWVTLRHVEFENFFISFLYIKNKSVQKIEKNYLQLRMFQDNVAKIIIQQNSTRIIIYGQKQTNFSGLVSDFIPRHLIIGDQQQIGTYICQISSFIIIRHNQKIDLIELYHKKMQIFQENGNYIDIVIKKSMAYLLKLLGDLELIMLIISHLIKKIDNQEVLSEMLHQVMDFLEQIAYIKGVTGIQLSEAEREKRICNVSCLSWLACRHKRHGKPIIEILRFLSIRKFEREIDNLQVLCNFALYKDMKYSDFRLILEKINQDMITFREKKENQQIIFRYCRLMLLDLTVFFKNTQFISQNLQQDALHKHSHILQIIYSQMIKFSTTFILDFIHMIVKVLFLLVDRRKENEHIDTTMGFQIANLAMKLAAFIFSKESEQIKYSEEDSLRKDSQEQILSKKEGISLCIREILYCLENQILYDEEARIRYYDWNISSETDLCGPIMKANESELIDICERIQIYIISGSIIYFQKLIQNSPSQSQINYFWSINLVQAAFPNDKIAQERIKFLMKFGPYGPKTQIKNREVIQKILSRSFQLVKIKSSLKLPKEFIEALHFNSVKYYLDYIFEIFLKFVKEAGSNMNVKCAFGQNFLYLLYAIPEAFYSNTSEMRYEVSKCKKLSQTLQFVKNHLIIKEISSFVEHLQVSHQKTSQQQKKKLSSIEFFSDIASQTQSQFSEDEVDNQIKQLLDEKKNGSIDLIKTSQIKTAFQELQLLINKSEISKFQKIENASIEYNEQQLEVLVQNFNINLSAVIELFSNDSSCNLGQKITKFKSVMFFVKSHACKFSSMIMEEYIFQKIKIGTRLKPNRKKSISVERGEVLHQEAQQILDEFLDYRKGTIHKIERFWANVQKNNKYFWEIFFSQDTKHQSLDSSCNQLKMRGLIKIDNEKRQIQLPKGVFMHSMKRSLSVSSDKELVGQGMSEDSMFSGSNLYQLQSSYEDKSQSKSPTKTQYDAIKKKKMRKINQFTVMWITTTTIYQGTLSADKNSIIFQEESPDQNLYDIICANEHERRTILNFQKQKQKIQINVNKRMSITPKRYLNYQTSLQICSDHQSYFFWFRKGSNRQKFIKIYEHSKNIFTNEQKIKEAAREFLKKWQHGDISNFTYLMHLNDLGSRTFNDLSQYYIFPWTVINFKDKMDKSFLSDARNFRDLGKPIGAINEERLKILQDKYKQSQRYTDIPAYLYGSFYSNPAIICNYLVRLQPFSFHHYLLQKNQFDLADRIFFSFADQFNGCYENVGDYKELIPQFYFFPQFLRNRSEYNFGYRQNKQIVHNVELPKWHKGQSPAEQSFIFGMRRALESEIVTKSLNKWIDLIFGVYSKKDRGLERANLFIDSIYRDKLKDVESEKDKQLCLIMYKQFGQVPRQLFFQQHDQISRQNREYLISQSKAKVVIPKTDISHNFYKLEVVIMNDNILWIDRHYNLVLSSNYKNDIIFTTSIFNQQQLKHFNEDLQSPHPTHLITGLHILQSQLKDSKTIDMIMYIKLGVLVTREIVFHQLKRKIQIREQNKLIIPSVAHCDLVEVYEDVNLLIVTEKSNLKIFRYELQTNSQGLLAIKKRKLMLEPVNQFTQHRSQIISIKVCVSYGLLLSLDSSHKIYVLKLSRNEISVIQSFKLKRLSFCQSVIHMKIHHMGYIIIQTSHHNIFVYNFMGDFIAKLDLENIEQCRIRSQITTSFDIWNHESSQLIIGTNFGNIYINDFLYPEEYQKLNVSRNQIDWLNVHRIGRHWKCLCFDKNSLYKVVSEKYCEAYRRNY